MDNIASLPGSTATTAQSQMIPTGSTVLGKDDFLQLLITQLGNQDPLNPMDGQQFAAQLAQFSSVEQLMHISDALAINGEMTGLLSQSINSGVAAGLIDRTVEAEGNVVAWSGSGEVNLGFELSHTATEIEVSITDLNGHVIRTINLNARDAGKHVFEWDGKNNDGAKVPQGSYAFGISAKDGSGERIDAGLYRSGQVDRVSFGPEGIMVWLGGLSIPMSHIRSVE